MEYGLDQVALTLGGRVIAGWGEGDVIAIKERKDRRDVQDCADGGVVINKIINDTAEMEITLRHGSTVQRHLADLDAAADSFSMGLTVTKGPTANATRCRVLKRPELTLGVQAKDRKWTILLTGYRCTWEEGGV